MIPVVPQRTRCWRAKFCYPSIAAAIAAAARLEPRPGRRFEVYYCPRHCNFHVGSTATEEKPECTQCCPKRS
jgi:hypothetical protein